MSRYAGPTCFFRRSSILRQLSSTSYFSSAVLVLGSSSSDNQSSLISHWPYRPIDDGEKRSSSSMSVSGESDAS
jgi:hypothetical protein